jgi:uncharacterized protein (TIGR03083 family)
VTTLTPAEQLAHLERNAARLAGLLAANDPGTPVPSCPGWDLRRLGEHVGRVHGWASGALAGDPDRELPEAPADAGGLAIWYAGLAAELQTALRGADPDAPAWTFDSDGGTAGFWHRRMALETAVHLWDAEDALGTPGPVDAGLAADGVDEVVRMFFPRQVRLARAEPLRRALAVEVTTAASAEDLVAGQPGSRTWVLAGDGSRPDLTPPPEAMVSGPAEPVLLVLWGRLPVTDPRVTVTGDLAVAKEVLLAGITP